MSKGDQKSKPRPPKLRRRRVKGGSGFRIGFGKVGRDGKPIIARELNFNFKRVFVWLIIFLLFLPAIFGVVGNLVFNQVSIPLSEAIEDIRAGRVKKVDVSGQELILHYQEDETEVPIKTSRKEETESLAEILERAEIDPKAVEINVQGGGLSGADIVNILTNVLFFVGLVFFFLWMMRQARGAQEGLFGFGKSNARLFTKGKQDVKFKDIGGLKEAKQELEEIVDFLKHPKKYRRVGARTPKGVLLLGPSGTGKTLLARAIAGEADVPFYSMAGSEFMEMLVGVGAKRARDLFKTAKAHAPSIIFIDEIDAIGQARGAALTGGHGEREQTLNQILVEMDGFEPTDNTIVIAASNRPSILDPALVRPGRFDRRVMLDLPDIDERKLILSIHAQGKPFVKEFSWDKVAKRTVGFSGADIENMLNEAAILTARRNGQAVSMDDVEEAATKVKLGPEKKRLQSDEERKMTAYHETGHAMVTHFLPKTDPVHRVSIVSRGLALGFTLMAPQQDKYHQTKSELEQRLATMLGGRAAEEIVFQEFTGGAASDIDQVTQIARRMVIDLGMSELGPIDFGPQYSTTEYGVSFLEPSNVSDRTQEKVDQEIKRIVDDAYQVALEIIKKQRQVMDRVVEKLLKQETIDGEEFEKLVGQPKAGRKAKIRASDK